MSINNEFNMVKDFHEAFGHPYAESPTLINLDRAEKRYSWMKEEIDEFIDATKDGDLYEQVDAMIDVIYFALGTLVELGVEPEKIFGIVHKANISKLWEDGKPRYNEFNKVIKPSNWQDPHNDIVEAINEMKV